MSTMSKHTPGLWTVIEGSIGANWSSKHIEAGGMAIAAIVDDLDVLKRDAPHNARLIAAAPAMFEALAIMVRVFNVDKIDPIMAFVAIEKAKEVIEKAEGKP